MGSNFSDWFRAEANQGVVKILIGFIAAGAAILLVGNAVILFVNYFVA